MRRTYLSSDFSYSDINGTYNMVENKSPFSSKMMDIEDKISISNDDIIYYQNSNLEQLDLVNELLLTPITYSPITSKFNNHNISIDKDQLDFDKENLTKWKLNINIKEILIEYIFAAIKRERSFELIENNKTKYNSVNLAIRNYITLNILSRYNITDIKLYLSYNSLNNVENLRFKNTWDSNIKNDFNLNKKINVEYNFDKSRANISFRQEKSSKEFSFDYYFDIIFEKI